MEVLKFNLKGDFAFFKIPNFNIFNLTYDHIPKPALLGMFGAICGYKGYRGCTEKDTSLEYMEKFKDIEVSIEPKVPVFLRHIQTFNNSSGCASKTDKIENLVTTVQLLQNVEWNIYIKNNNSASYELLKHNLINYKAKYIPYLGNNSYLAEISQVEVINGEEVTEIDFICKSLIIRNVLRAKKSTSVLERALIRNSNFYEYHFNIPVGLDNNLLYEDNEFILTNIKVNIGEESRKMFLRVRNENLFFY